MMALPLSLLAQKEEQGLSEKCRSNAAAHMKQNLPGNIGFLCLHRGF